MIRLTFMTDAHRVIGASTAEGNARRFQLLPPALPRVMAGLYAADTVAVGRRSLGGAAQPALSESAKLIVTTDPDLEAAAELAHAEVCTNHVELIERFRDSDDELNVIGGLTVFRMFLHNADRLDIAETSAAVPGDLVFDDWVAAGFDVTVVEEWEGGRTLRARRPAGTAARNKRNAMALYDVMFNWNRPREAARLYLGEQYRQHNPHVAEGPAAFVEYFERMARDYPGKTRDVQARRRRGQPGGAALPPALARRPRLRRHGHLPFRRRGPRRRALGRPAGSARPLRQPERYVLSAVQAPPRLAHLQADARGVVGAHVDRVVRRHRGRYPLGERLARVRVDVELREAAARDVDADAVAPRGTGSWCSTGRP